MSILYSVRCDDQIIDPFGKKFPGIAAFIEIVLELDLRVRHGETRNGEPADPRITESDGESQILPGRAEDIGLHLLHIPQDRIDMNEGDLPCFVQINSVGSTVKQFCPQFILQLFEHRAHGRLADMELLRSLRQ